MEFCISPQSGQFYMINILENQWLSVNYICHGIMDNFVQFFAYSKIFFFEITNDLRCLKATLNTNKQNETTDQK